MSLDSDYAVLSTLAYNDIRQRQNRAVLPLNWTELTQFEVSGSGANASLLSSGLSAKVFKNTSTGDVVISYAGTESSDSIGRTVDFLYANIPAFFGLTSPQAVAAAELYRLVSTSASLAGANITFTGHSLGGGLAAMMGVLFDKPAVVFAPAPFAASLHNYTSSDYTPQLANVRSYATTGDALDLPMVGDGGDFIWAMQNKNTQAENCYAN